MYFAEPPFSTTSNTYFEKYTQSGNKMDSRNICQIALSNPFTLLKTKAISFKWLVTGRKLDKTKLDDAEEIDVPQKILDLYHANGEYLISRTISVS